MRRLPRRLIAALPPSVVPTPIGVGARYQPAAATHAVRGLLCTRGGARYGVHVELFANRRVVLIPSGIGVAQHCSFSLSTRTPEGVVEVHRGATPTLGGFFAVWGMPLSRTRLASFRGRVLAFVDGRRWRGDPRAIPLRRHAEIVLEVGGYVPPHPSYRFRDGL
jgi:hypothetical protein